MSLLPEEVSEGLKMLVMLMSGWTGRIHEVKRSYSDLQAALAEVSLAILQNGSEVQQKIVLTLLKDFAYLNSTNPQDIHHGEINGESVELKQLEAISFKLAAMLVLANGDNTPVSASVFDVLKRYKHMVDLGHYSVDVEMEMKNIAKPNERGTVFADKECLKDKEITLLSTVPSDRNVSIKVSGISASEKEGFVAEAANVFKRNGISVYSVSASTMAIEFSVTLSSKESIREHQWGNLQRVLSELHCKYAPRGINGNSNSGEYEKPVKFYENAVRVTLIGHEVKSNPLLLAEIAAVFPRFGYQITSMSLVNEAESISLEVKYMGEDEPEANPSEILHLYFLENKKSICGTFGIHQFLQEMISANTEKE